MDKPFVICKAAAGSGKTFALVKEYLKLAMAGPQKDLGGRFRGILAITFTNKAANEMKERLMRFLETIAQYGADPTHSAIGAALLQDLNAMSYYEGHPLDSDQLKQMASDLHSAILHRYSDLSVLTIDSFMHRVVRTFAHDLGQPVNFEVLVEQDDLLRRVVEELMAKMGADDNEALTRLMQHSAEVRMEDEHSYDIEADLLEVAKQLLAEDAATHLHRLAALNIDDFMTIRSRYVEANNQFKKQLRELGAEALGVLVEAGVPQEHTYQGSNGYYGYFARLAEGKVLDSKGRLYRPSSKVSEAFEEGKLSSTKCKGSDKAALEALMPRLADCYHRIVALLEADGLRYVARCQVMGGLYSIALLSEMARIMHQCSAADEVLHLSEFNKLINHIVDQEDAPFIYERLGNRYRHFLIDEFQDTSILQWHNLVPLVENGVAQGMESLVVGDAKQAIYRFRQGDVRQFIDLPEVKGMALHGRALSMRGNYQVLNLDTNWRTGRAVVEFNNQFFSWLVRQQYAHNPLLQQIYVGGKPDELRHMGDEELRQRPMRSNEGYVKVQFEEEVEASVLEAVRHVVQDCGYAYSDIMILSRYNRQLNAVADQLKQAEVPITSTESFQLRSSVAVCAIVATLQWLQDPANRTTQAQLLARLAAAEVVPADWEARWLESGLCDVQPLLASWGIELRPAYLHALDLYDLCEELVHLLRLDYTDVLYVSAFLNDVASFTSRHKQHLTDLLEHYESTPKLSATSSDQVDAVRLMTYHKAKGLEAPVVICAIWHDTAKSLRLWVQVPEGLAEGVQLPDALVSIKKEDHSLFDSYRDEERMMAEVDEVNNLYVALTRPEEQLYIVCEDPATQKRSAEGQLPDLLQRYMQQEEPYCGVEPIKAASSKPADEKKVIVLDELPYADWSSRVSFASPSSNATTRLLEPRLRFGLYAHDLLSHVLHADDVDRAVAHFFQQHQLEDDERQRLDQLAHQVVVHPSTARFFAPQNKALTECWMMDGGVASRPDRVVFAGNEAWVVDFKTGDVESPEHHNQVRGYCRAVAATGWPVVRGFLLYTQPSIHVVDVQL